MTDLKSGQTVEFRSRSGKLRSAKFVRWVGGSHWSPSLGAPRAVTYAEVVPEGSSKAIHVLVERIVQPSAGSSST